MKCFEVGHSYEFAERFDPIKILHRTAKSIKVTNGQTVWYMRIRMDEEENTEYVIDTTTAGKRYRNCLTCKAIWEAE